MIDSPWVGIYLRKSRDKADLADPDLLHKHRREMLRLSAARGHPVPPERIYEEQGSGDLLRVRPVCRRLLEDIARLPRGAGGCLWTTEVSRLTRGSLADRAIVYEALSHAAVIHCTRDREYDLRKASDLYYWETETAQARRELGVYKERVESARLEMLAEGRIPTGKPPFGWWWDRNEKNPNGSRGRIRPHPEQFPIVQALCREVHHLSTYHLAARYGLPQPLIYYLLANPFICGQPARRHWPHGGERKRQDNGEPWQNASERLPRLQWIWPDQDGDYEPACTREEWDLIQRVLADRRKRPGHTGIDNAWCRDVVRFAGCPAEHARLAAKGNKPWQKLVYEASLPRGSTLPWIEREAVHAAAQEAILALLADPDRLRWGIDTYLASRRDLRVIPEDASLGEAVRTYERKLDALLDRELDAAERRDVEDLASIRRQRDEYKRCLAAARAQVAALSTSRPPDDGVDGLIAWLPEVGAETLAGAWERIDDAGRRIVTRGLVEVILCRVEQDPGARWCRREVEEVRLKEMWRK